MTIPEDQIQELSVYRRNDLHHMKQWKIPSDSRIKSKSFLTLPQRGIASQTHSAWSQWCLHHKVNVVSTKRMSQYHLYIILTQQGLTNPFPNPTLPQTTSPTSFPCFAWMNSIHMRRMGGGRGHVYDQGRHHHECARRPEAGIKLGFH